MDEINKCFKQLDKEGSGLIKMSDVVKQIKKSKSGKKRAKLIERTANYDPDKTINYTEYLAKMVDVRTMIKNDDLRKIFKQLSSDNSGYINEKDIDTFLKRKNYVPGNN